MLRGDELDPFPFEVPNTIQLLKQSSTRLIATLPDIWLFENRSGTCDPSTGLKQKNDFAEELVLFFIIIYGLIQAYVFYIVAKIKYRNLINAANRANQPVNPVNQ